MSRPMEALQIAAKRTDFSVMDLRVFLWIFTTQARGQRYFYGEVATALACNVSTVQRAINDLLERGVLECLNARGPRTPGKELRVADPTQWKPAA